MEINPTEKLNLHGYLNIQSVCMPVSTGLQMCLSGEDLCKKGGGTSEKGFRGCPYYDVSSGELVWEDGSAAHVKKGFLDTQKSQMWRKN